MYWEGPPKPILQKCEESIRHWAEKGGFTIRKLSPSNLSSYLKMPKDISHLKPSKKTDIYRAALLYHYGGFWMDMDSLGAGPFSFLDCIADQSDFFVFRLDYFSSITMCLLYSAKGSPVAKDWLRSVEKMTKKSKFGSGHRSMGCSLLNPVTRKHYPDIHCLQATRSVIVPTDVEVEELKGDLCSSRRYSQSIIMLINSKFPERINNLSLKDLESDGSRIAHLLRSHKTFHLDCPKNEETLHPLDFVRAKALGFRFFMPSYNGLKDITFIRCGSSKMELQGNLIDKANQMIDFLRTKDCRMRDISFDGGVRSLEDFVFEGFGSFILREFGERTSFLPKKFKGKPFPTSYLTKENQFVREDMSVIKALTILKKQKPKTFQDVEISHGSSIQSRVFSLCSEFQRLSQKDKPRACNLFCQIVGLYYCNGLIFEDSKFTKAHLETTGVFLSAFE